MTCGLCGMSFKAEAHPNHRYYSCRGRLKQHRLDGSPRCTSPRLNADWLEEQIWRRVEAIVNDPNILDPLLRETIESLKNREEELRARILPVEEQLAQVAEQKTKLADKWVTSNLPPERFHQLRQDLEKEEARLTSIRASIDPAQIQELESTRGLLRFWQKQVDSMAWNTEEEDGRMVRLVDAPHRAVLRLAGLESAELSEYMRFPATRRELLQKLQVRAVVFHGKIDVEALFPIEPVYHQKCTSP